MSPVREPLLYVGFYDSPANVDEQRTSWPSATNKMDYICSVAVTLGLDVLIVSPSRTSKNTFYSGKRTRLADHVCLKLFPTFPWGNRAQRAFSIIAGHLQLWLYLVLRARRNQNVLVYHSLGLIRAVRYAQLLRRFRLILEVEEIYQDATPVGQRLSHLEYLTFAHADAFIFSTALLNERLNSESKPNVVIHGSYRAERDLASKFVDGKKHVVYAGIIDSDKGGAFTAAAAAAFLDETYHVHILGFGQDDDVERLRQLVRNTNDTARAAVSYDGLLRGADLSKFLQQCSIGLSTQNPAAAFNETSFPSKILTYMANGLAVVSVRMRSLEESALGDAVHFYDGADPDDVARAIRIAANATETDSRQLLDHLDRQCTRDLRALLNDVTSK